MICPTIPARPEPAPKHTPGPWILVPQNGAGPMLAVRFETGKQMNPTGLRFIGHLLERKDSLDVDEANARIIAAAPAMLAALKSAAGQIDNAMIANQVAAAIRLAEGE
jgi:hypothetical protein